MEEFSLPLEACSSSCCSLPHPQRLRTTHVCSFPWEVLFLEEGLPQATPCSQNRLQRPWNPLLVGPHAATCDAASSREDWFCSVFFFLHGPYLCLSPPGVSYQTTVGLELKSQTLAAEAALEVAGLCREGLGRPVLSQAVGVRLKGITLWREFGCFSSRVDWHALYRRQSTSGTPAYRNPPVHRAQSTRVHGSESKSAQRPTTRERCE